MAEKIEALKAKGMGGKAIRVMVVGIPNAGKSSLINRLAGSRKAKVEDRPGVTLNKQWVATSAGFELLDMPGVLWPKFDDRLTGEKTKYRVDWIIKLQLYLKDGTLYNTRTHTLKRV